MKKVYVSFVLLLAFSFGAKAQGGATSCLDTDTIRITFDLSKNCTTAPGSLAGMSNIGFHSGADSWSTVVDWDAAGAVQAKNDGNDMFSVAIEPISYYGLAAAPTDIKFVFNQGPTDAAAPWGSEGKDQDAAGCTDFVITVADLAACTTSDTEVELAENKISIAPNPMSGSRTSLFLNNTKNEVFNMVITNTMGQVVRSQNNVTGDIVTIERGNLTTGVYFILLQSESGVKLSERLVIQ